jgi:hypothetical protein
VTDGPAKVLEQAAMVLDEEPGFVSHGGSLL